MAMQTCSFVAGLISGLGILSASEKSVDVQEVLSKGTYVETLQALLLDHPLAVLSFVISFFILSVASRAFGRSLLRWGGVVLGSGLAMILWSLIGNG
jgi:hypothetical protein